MSLTKDQKKNLEKVIKLLNMTVGNGCSVEEADNAKRQAEKLMEKHSLSINDIEDSVISTDVMYMYDESDNMYTRIPSWMKVLYQFTYEAFGVSVTWGRDAEGINTIHFSGTQTDREVAGYCSDLMWEQIVELSKEYRNKAGVSKGSKENNAFLYTVSSTVVSRLKSILEGVQSPGKNKNAFQEAVERSEKALVVFQKETGMLIRKTKTKGRFNSEGFEAASKVKVNSALGA